MRYQEVREREAQVEKMIEEGVIMADMARRLGITPQSVQKFLRVRGWEGRVAKGAPGHTKPLDPEAAALKAKRKAERQKMNSSVDRSGVKKHTRKTKPKGK